MSDHFRSLAASDRIKAHSLADDVESADVILFVDLHQFPFDWQLKELQRHPLSLRYGQKVMVYDERDRPFCTFPGLYVSMAKSAFDSSRQRASSYCYLKNELIEASGREPDLLFSFQGANSHPARAPIFHLAHERGLIEDTTRLNFFDFSANSETEEYKNSVQAQKERYKEVVARSKFVLCPRGTGTSSFRLYETLAAGRVPVIISDEWVAPVGPDWEACSIRVKENEVAALPRLLESREAQWQQMAHNARQTFQHWFASDVLFHQMSEQCRDLLENGQLGLKPHLMRDGAFRATGRDFYKNQVRARLGGYRRALLSKLKK